MKKQTVATLKKKAENQSYYERNRDKLKEKQRQYYYDNHETEKEKRRQSSILRYKRLREAVFTKLGQTCSECGYANKLALHFDHIDGGGRKHRLVFGGNYCGYYQSILKEPYKYQVLCANCNTLKMYLKKEHPRTFNYET